VYFKERSPNGYSLSGLWDAGAVDRFNPGVCGAPAVQVQSNVLGISLHGSKSAEMVAGGHGRRLVREETPQSFPHHVMELARGIEPPTCGLQNPNEANLPTQQTPDKIGESLDGSQY